MNNIQQVINSHNKTILTSAAKKKTIANFAAAERKTLAQGVVYQATIVQKHTNQIETYIGIKENEFKTTHLQLPTTTQKVHHNSK